MLLRHLPLQSGNRGLLGLDLRLLLQEDRDQVLRTEWSQFLWGHARECTIKLNFFQSLGEGFSRLKTKENSNLFLMVGFETSPYLYF
jgi:hypothetical protein